MKPEVRVEKTTARQDRPRNGRPRPIEAAERCADVPLTDLAV